LAEKCIVVQNAAEEKFAKASPKEFIEKYRIHLKRCCNRSKKNTHTLIRAASLEKLPLLLIGAYKEDEYINYVEKKLSEEKPCS
jgi:hypothetical protein